MNSGRRLLVGVGMAGAFCLVVVIGLLLWRLHESGPVIAEAQARAIAIEPGICGTTDGQAPQVIVTWAAYEQGQANDKQGRLLYPNGSPFWVRPFLSRQFWVVETSAPPQDMLSSGGATLHLTRGDFQIVLEAHSGAVLYCGGHSEASG
jgi:hypothetical protein